MASQYWARCSLKPPLSSVLSLIEEGKASPSDASTIIVTTVSPSNAHKTIAELLGTFVIMFVGCASWMIDQRYHVTLVGVAIAWGLVLMVMIYTFGRVSGAHFNPAVTIALAASAKFPWRQVPAYVAAQLAGSTLAVLTLAMLLHEQMNIGVTVTQYSKPKTHCEAFAWEFILSFILMLTICGVAADNRAINELSGITVGATMLFDVLVAGNITGASMNPARSIGPALVSGQLHSLWLYILAPTLGTITASSIYCLVWFPLPENFGEQNTKE
ncbi:nodulin-26-like [Mangifera indica]|uniref:nodulin-26-like n=1 Tax=Mangifera indica TaxID=29780 RepID=UPI001CF94F5D|nr:nodulin-26-like [Mangifera indica]